MFSKTTIAALILVLSCAGVASADHDITIPYLAPEGTAVIDGDLTDWAGSTWIMLDEDYSPTTSDITEAKYALRWSSATNMVYVAVSVIDTIPLFEDHWVSWNTQDDVELYIDAGENNTYEGGAGGMGNYGTYQDYAQQMAMGYHADGTWANFGWLLGENLSVCPEYVAAFDAGTGTITYEAAFVPYSYFTGFGGTALPEAIVTLAPDMLIGFDVVVGAMKDADTANFAMASNNLVGGKFKWSVSMQTWQLVGGGCAGADFDGDGDVDLDDFVILKTNFGTGTTQPEGDADCDGDVDLDDFVILKSTFGS